MLSSYPQGIRLFRVPWAIRNSYSLLTARFKQELNVAAAALVQERPLLRALLVLRARVSAIAGGTIAAGNASPLHNRGVALW